MSKVEELWEKYSVPEMIDNHFHDIIGHKNFLAALEEYGQAVREQCAEKCEQVNAPMRFSGPKEFIGLTDEEILSALDWVVPFNDSVTEMAKAEMIELARKIEKKLKEKNT